MTVGSIEGRLVLSGVLVTAMFVLEVVIPDIRAALRRQWEKKHGHRHHHHEAAAKNDPAAAAVRSVAASNAKRTTTAKGRTPPETRAPEAAKEDPICAEAARLWHEASEIAHSHLPSWENDGKYLNLVVTAAKLGRVEAMGKLGDFAFCRKVIDEAFYWKMKVKIRGARVPGVQLRDILKLWKKMGCPRHGRSFTPDFGEPQADYARAALKLMCGLDGHNARKKIRDLSAAGNKDATDFMHWHDGYRKREKEKGSERGGGRRSNLSRIWKSYGNRTMK